MEAIEELGYRANQAARQMRTGRSRLIAARIEPTRDGIDGSVLDRFLHGLTEAAAAAGYRVLLYTADDDQSEIATYRRPARRRTNWTPSCSPAPTTATRAPRGWPDGGVPFVTFGRPWGAPEARHPWVDVDGAAGTAAATRHLLDAGHRRIGFLGWPAGSGVGDDRRAGWARTLAAAGVDPAGLDRATDGRRGRRRGAWHATCSTPTARRPRWSAPATRSRSARCTPSLRRRATGGMPIAVIGFDDTPVARRVGLTSVSQPLAEAAACCVALLAHALDGACDGRHGELDEARRGAPGLVATPAGTETSRSRGRHARGREARRRRCSFTVAGRAPVGVTPRRQRIREFR